MSIVPSRSSRTPARRAAAVALTLVMSSALSAKAADHDGTMGSSGEAARSGAAAPRLGIPTLPGIDVSHWQGSIDWAKVANAGKRFVFMKATEGQSYVDPMFTRNRADARANGLMVGAYHFAKPDGSAGDATQEARHFVSVADPKAGHLLPVLDIETNDGLDQQEMTQWAVRWVKEVRELTGVTPLVYTSPYGWLERFGDTRRLAREGARLWVAHWGVSSPTMPAGNWDGAGWLVWQHTSTGHVAGIEGNVDLDRLAGTSLGRIAIRRLTVEVSGGAGAVTTSPAGYGCRTTCARNIDPGGQITLAARPDDGAYFKGWNGDCAGAATTCTVAMNGNRTVTARFVTDIEAPVASIEAPIAFTDPAIVRFDEPVRGVDRSNVVMRAVGDARVDATSVCRNATGTVIGCDKTTVRSVRLLPAEPLVPGREYRVLVNPANATSRVKDRVGNAAAGTGRSFESARDVEDGAAPIERKPSSAWHRERFAAATGGSFLLSQRKDAAVRMAFEGVEVEWWTITGPNRGRAKVYVDGTLVRTVDLYSATRTPGGVVTIDGLADRLHQLRIVVAGTSRPASAGHAVAIDRFVVT